MDKPPVDRAKRLAVLGQRYPVHLLDDFRAYLLEASPGGEYWDEEGTTWWGTERIRNIPDEFDYGEGDARIMASAGQYLFFADYLVWCFAWAICCAKGEDFGQVVVIGGGQSDRVAADSFTDFVDRYLRDPDQFFGG